ncbi:MAG: RNA polymerase-associated protein RapA [Gammaproteobacteria bacterium]|nr:RNA polymerase-associated protein RapA [Gammaproteobacteria bacterium]
MTRFIPGQRWISDTESELGLGTVLKTEGRTVTLLFMAAGETRVYAVQNAPLTRVLFSAGDEVESHEGWQLQISHREESDGLMTYRGLRDDGSEASLSEGELSNLIRFNKPQDRLLTGQIDALHWFDLRHQTLEQLGRLEQSPILGLAGGRIDLIPHQLYIAHEVANRPSPRVLLADEVGLGKTIEACLILHHQLLTGRAGRVMILVPDPLVHQWLVELLRRFNLKFSVLDEARCTAIQESGQNDNPFHAEQLVLCSLQLFKDNPQRLTQALAGEWDLLIVDEAHHLTWSEDAPSAEYLLVEALSLTTPGILLLTATPEQLGQAGHFARLRLLDPDRYYDLGAFLEEERNYQPVADAVELLVRREPLPERSIQHLLDVLEETDSSPLIQLVNNPTGDPARREEARQALIQLLLDRHGTGRVLFRNTRARISGFPQRELHTYPLQMPETFAHLIRQADASRQVAVRLSPERLYPSTNGDTWWTEDPRIDWLIRFLQQLVDSKVLLICAQAATAIEIQAALRIRSGIGSALFHEGMSILERDRAAAWFADMANGARILLCSEIGSEGRNFQFAHHLVLFDLPLDPDLLEQRIGRLDRIGQQETVHIHVPYLYPGPQAVLLRWYQEGLDAFRRHVPGAQSIRAKLDPVLHQALEEEIGEEDLDLLIETTRDLVTETRQRLEKGRNHLLELGACREPAASRLVSRLAAQDQDPALRSYLHRLFSSFNVESEDLGLESFTARPGEQVATNSLPGLNDEGLTLTLSRPTALAHEDRQFITWEHPLIRDAMQLVIDQETGNSCAIGFRHSELAPGQLLLEGLFLLHCVAPRSLQAGRFLPPTLIRVLINDQGERFEDRYGCSELTDSGQPLDAQTLAPVIRQYRQPIRRLTKAALDAAHQASPELIQGAVKRMMEHYTAEIQRMVALKRHNPNVRSEEIEALQAQGLALHEHLQAAGVRWDAVRLIVTL